MRARSIFLVFLISTGLNSASPIIFPQGDHRKFYEKPSAADLGTHCFPFAPKLIIVEKKASKEQTLSPYERQVINEGVITFTNEERDVLIRLPNKHCKSPAFLSLLTS